MMQHAEIVSAIRSGKHTIALSKLELLLAADPKDPELLAIKGLALAVAGQVEEAADAVRRAIRHAATPALALKYAGNLARLLAHAGRWQDVAALADADLPSPSLVPDTELDMGSVEVLCSALVAAGKADFAVELLGHCLDRQEATWALEVLWLKAAERAQRHEDVLARTGAPSYRWRDMAEASAFACTAALQLKRSDDADRLYAAYLATTTYYAAPRAAHQIMSIAVISPNPHAGMLTLPAAQQHFSRNFPSQLARLRADRYRFFSVFIGSRSTSIPPETYLHHRAITLNNCANAEELKRGGMARVEQHETALGLPVVNAAAQAIHCTRVETAEILRGIPNLIVPKIMHLRLEKTLLAELRSRIKGLFAYPVIVRTVGQQEAANLYLAANDEELDTALSNLMAFGNNAIYVIDFVNVTHRDGMHRKLRAAFVEGVPTLVRADYDPLWVITGRKAENVQQTYKRDMSLLAHADQIVRQPQQLGKAAWDTLAEIGRRIPLDVFGLDFDVDEDGRVVFFESNATMNLLSTAPPEMDYPAEAQQDFLNRLDALFLKRAGLTIQ